MTVDTLAQLIGAQVVGDGSAEISSVATLEDATADQVSFLSNIKYTSQLKTTKASAVIVSTKTVPVPGLTLLRADDPYYALMQTIVALHGHRKHPFDGVHPGAHVDPLAMIGQRTTVYPG